jgi:hypothetical protein
MRLQSYEKIFIRKVTRLWFPTKPRFSANVSENSFGTIIACKSGKQQIRNNKKLQLWEK